MNPESLQFNPENTNYLEVDFIRHGDTDYLENKELMEDDLEVIPVDLTDVGIEQITKVGTEIINKIDPEKEVVILWSSPAWRAQGSEGIIENLLIDRGITIFKKTIVNAMSPVTRYGEKIDLDADAKVRKNAENVFNWIRFMAEKADNIDKKVHIIGVTHHEFLNPIREDVFPFDVPNGKGFQKGENINFKFVFDRVSKELSITASLRDYEVKDIKFDKQTRKFVFLKK